MTKNSEPIELPLEARERFTGHCILWNYQKNSGLIYDETSDAEYPVKGDDIIAVDNNNQKLHCLETVEFALLPGDDGKTYARFVTKPGLERVKHIWRSSRRHGKEAPVSNTRHLGFIEKFQKGHHGFIVFKTDNFRNIYFPETELRTTGAKLIHPGSEVEFEVKMKEGKVQARNITKVGGDLITFETGMLGAMLRKSNILVEKRTALEPNAEVRIRGIVGHWYGRDETGSIWPCNGHGQLLCKAQDITSTGFKMLRPNTEVEFTVIKENNDLRAMKVTGPNGEPYIDAEDGPVFDHFKKIKKSFEEKEVLGLDPEHRFTGWIKHLTNNDEFGFIESSHPEGRKHVEFTYHQICWEGPGFPHIPVNTPVEFSSCAWDDGTVRAIRVTRIGGEPFRLSEKDMKEYEEMKKQENQMKQNLNEKEEEKNSTGVKKEIAKPVYESTSPLILPARPRKENLKTLVGIVVDYNVPSLKGILQPLSGPEGGEHKELLQFDISQLQCEGFRGVEKWQKVEFSRVEENERTRAVFITALGNKLINFDEKKLLKREQLLIQAHQQKLVKRNAGNRIHFNANSRKHNTRNWMGNIMPYPMGMPPFPPPMMPPHAMPPMMDMPPPFFGNPSMHYFPPPPFAFQQFMPY